MDGNKIKVVLDTNIIISAIGFGGKPRKILNLVLDKRIRAVTSPMLLAEFEDIIFKKFPILVDGFGKINRQLRKNIKLISPEISLHVLKDEPDNRVLETAISGKCNFIVTGDKELLKLYKFQKIRILTADEFLRKFDSKLSML